MKAKPLQFSLARLFGVISAACVALGAAAWLGGDRLASLAGWAVLLLITTLPIYAFALSVVVMVTPGGTTWQRRWVQVVLFLCCLPFGWLAFVAVRPFLR